MQIQIRSRVGTTLQRKRLYTTTASNIRLTTVVLCRRCNVGRARENFRPGQAEGGGSQNVAFPA